MTASSVPFIRPLTLGQLLDQSIGLYRRNFAAFIGIIAIPYIPLTLLQTALSYLSVDSAVSILETPPLQSSSPFGLPTGYWAGLVGILFVGLIQFILVNGVATAAFTRAVANNYTGKEIGVIDSYRQLGNSWLRLIGALLLAILIGIPLGIWVIIPCVGWFTGPGLFFFLSLVVIPLVAPVIVLERHDVASSLRRAWDLGRSRFWWLIGFAFVLFLLGQLIITGPTYVISAILQFVFLREGNMQATLVWRPIVQMLVQMSGGLLYLPLQLTAMTLVYFDLRVRSEGLDLALQAASDSGAETNIVAIAETSPTPTGDFITSQDALNFFGLSLAGIAVYFVIIAILLGLSMLLVAGL
jgi:hypothetical protein